MQDHTHTRSDGPLILFALGNPGEQYSHTRHNAGRLFVTYLREKYSLPDGEFHKKTNALITKIPKGTALCDCSTLSRDVLLVESLSFMNHSGLGAGSVTNFFKVDSRDNLIIIHDDLDIAVGKFKLAFDRSGAGHNGVIDVIEKLGTQSFHRLRIGIDNDLSDDRKKLPPREFVLRDFSHEETDVLTDVYSQAWDAVRSHYDLTTQKNH